MSGLTCAASLKCVPTADTEKVKSGASLLEWGNSLGILWNAVLELILVNLNDPLHHLNCRGKPILSFQKEEDDSNCFCCWTVIISVLHFSRGEVRTMGTRWICCKSHHEWGRQACAGRKFMCCLESEIGSFSLNYRDMLRNQIVEEVHFKFLTPLLPYFALWSLDHQDLTGKASIPCKST